MVSSIISAVKADEINVVVIARQLHHSATSSRSHRYLGRTGLLLFELERHIFSYILNGSSDEHLWRNFYPHEARRVDPSILCVLFINVKAY